MSGRGRIFGRARPVLPRDSGGEALVERLDGEIGRGAKGRHETFGFPGLRAELAPERHGQPDDDALRALAAREIDDAGESLLARGMLDDLQGSGNRSGRVRDGDAGPRRAVVERKDPHRRAILAAGRLEVPHGESVEQNLNEARARLIDVNGYGVAFSFGKTP